MRIDLGGIARLFSWLFNRKKKEEQEVEWQPITGEDVLNCCEQSGMFEELNVSDETVINKVCNDVADIFNSGKKSQAELKDAVIKGFAQNSYDVSDKKAKLFVECYIDSYLISHEE